MNAWPSREGWYVERDGRRLALLTDPSFVEMFWTSYRIVPLVEDAQERELILGSPPFWASTLTLRDRASGEIARHAFPAGAPFPEPGRVLMRGLYLVREPTVWGKILEWVLGFLMRW
jgi:hypothetical protein